MRCQAFALLSGLLITATEAADCDLTQSRQSDSPSGEQISSALTKQGSLDNICSNDWPPQQDLIKTYNEGSVIFNVSRQATDEVPADNNCQAGFQNIIDQCIVSSSYWGGSYTFNDFTYVVTNSTYPSNGLPPTDTEPSVTGQSVGAATSQPKVTSTIAAPGSTHISNVVPATPISGQTIVTETNTAGSQIVATFAPTTLTQYTSLTSSITITSTTIDSNGAPLLIPVIIGAGGIAWVIAGGAPPPGIQPPGGIPDGGDGDNNPNTNSNDSPTATNSNSHVVSTTVQSSSAASSTDGPSVTAIGDPEYPDIGNLQALLGSPSGPLPSEESSVVSSTAKPPAQVPSTTLSRVVSTTVAVASGPCEDDCTAIVPQLSIYGDMICSEDDLGKFIDHGTTADPNGEADWFRISSHGNCYLVMAKSAAHRGFPDQNCFQKSAIIDFVNQNALGCNVGDPFNRKSGAQPAESQFTGQGEVCLANFNNYQSCGESDL